MPQSSLPGRRERRGGTPPRRRVFSTRPPKPTSAGGPLPQADQRPAHRRAAIRYENLQPREAGRPLRRQPKQFYRLSAKCVGQRPCSSISTGRFREKNNHRHLGRAPGGHTGCRWSSPGFVTGPFASAEKPDIHQTSQDRNRAGINRPTAELLTLTLLGHGLASRFAGGGLRCARRLVGTVAICHDVCSFHQK